MYAETVQWLRGAGLVQEGDVVIACMDAPGMAAGFWGGAIGAAIAQSNAKRYILAANPNEIRLFDTDSAFVYQNSFVPIPRQEAVRASIGGAFDGCRFIIQKPNEKIKINAYGKVEGFKQKEAFKALRELFKAYWGGK